MSRRNGHVDESILVHEFAHNVMSIGFDAHMTVRAACSKGFREFDLLCATASWMRALRQRAAAAWPNLYMIAHVHAATCSPPCRRRYTAFMHKESSAARTKPTCTSARTPTSTGQKRRRPGSRLLCAPTSQMGCARGGS